jgi:hypothetical protein
MHPYSTGNFTQHSEPFKHDAARWAKFLLDLLLLPFVTMNAPRVAHGPAQLKRRSSRFRQGISPHPNELQRKTFTKARPLATRRWFLLISGEGLLEGRQ